MRNAWIDLWRPSGTVDRRRYALVGAVGFAVKHNVDRLVATLGFHRPWGLLNYWVPLSDVRRVRDLDSHDAIFLETMLVVALPFIWLGVAMTLKRLRSARLPIGFLVLFFVPFVNLLCFLVLCLWPEREFDERAKQVSAPNELLYTRILPQSALGSAVLSLLVTVPVGLAMVFFAVNVLTKYGWGLFVALPFTMGFSASLIYGMRQPRSHGASVGVACLSVGLLGLGLLAFALEGLICLLMALPIALPLAALGGEFGYLLLRWRWSQAGTPMVFSALVLVVTSLQWTEHRVQKPAPVFVVRSSIDIQAPPLLVWRQVVAFNQIPPPTEWVFRAGVAYPIRAEMRGIGPGAERHCVFSTGSFIEPIEVWDEPRRLKFSVSSNPPPLEELSPYPHIDPPHLHGFLVSKAGQFLLTPRANGGTRLEGTTWYQHGLWPAAYWRLWSDAIIHRIHLRVLTHIRNQVEDSAGKQKPD